MTRFATVFLTIVATTPIVAGCGRDGTPAPAAPAVQAEAESHGVGVVQSVDSASGALTIAHEPIESLGWPAMTMAFKVARPDLLNGVAAGQRIEFTLRGRDMAAVVTSIDAVP